jgi:phage gpG-like protein
MAGRITFTWDPDPTVFANRFFAVADALENRTLPLLAASETMQHDIRERFETETAPDGTPWEPWSENYRPVAEGYPNEGILTRSGALKDAASSSEAMVVTKDTVFYQTTLLPHYGLAHDQGLPDRKAGLPKREFIGMSDEAAMVVIGEFGEWFDRSIDLYSTGSMVGRRHAIHGAGGLFVSRSSVGKAPLAAR